MRSGPLAAALVAIVCSYGCRAAIEESLTEEQANDAVVALHRAGIAVEKERAEGAATAKSRYRIAVATEDVPRALAILRALELPRQSEPGLKEVFAEASLVPTAVEERAKLTSAISGELARSIERMEGVLDARVHVALPERREVFTNEGAPRARASVLVKHNGQIDTKAIRGLVAYAVADLAEEDVAVVGVPVRSLPAQSRAPAFVHVGPIAVAASSAALLRGILGGALGLLVVLSAIVLVLLLRIRRRAEVPAQL